MEQLLARSIAAAGWIAMGVIRIYPELRMLKFQTMTRASGPIDLALLALATLSGIPSFVWIFTPWLQFADYSLPAASLIVGGLMMANGCWIIYGGHQAIGENFDLRLRIRENHQLVTHGPYRYVRHPIYSGALLFAMGHTLVVPNLIAGPAFLVGLVILIAFRIGPEEKMMADQFGEEFETYCQTTARLIPWIL